MDKAKLFKASRSQAVRLPKAYRMPETEIKISREGNKVTLVPISAYRDSLVSALDEFPDDFIREGRQQPVVQPDHML